MVIFSNFTSFMQDHSAVVAKQEEKMNKLFGSGKKSVQRNNSGLGGSAQKNQRVGMSSMDRKRNTMRILPTQGSRIAPKEIYGSSFMDDNGNGYGD